MNTAGQPVVEAPKKKQGFFGKVKGGLKGLFKKTKKNTVKGVASNTEYTTRPVFNSPQAGPEKGRFAQLVNKTKKAYGDAKKYVGDKFMWKTLYSNYLRLNIKIQYMKTDSGNYKFDIVHSYKFDETDNPEQGEKQYTVLEFMKEIKEFSLKHSVTVTLQNIMGNTDAQIIDWFGIVDQEHNVVTPEGFNRVKGMLADLERQYNKSKNVRAAVREEFDLKPTRFEKAKSAIREQKEKIKYMYEHRTIPLMSNFLGLYKLTYKLDEHSQHILTAINKKTGAVDTHYMIRNATALYKAKIATPGEELMGTFIDGQYVIAILGTFKKQLQQLQALYEKDTKTRRSMRNIMGVSQTKLGRLASQAGNKYRTAKAGVVAGYQKTKKAIVNKYEKVVSKAEFKRKLDKALGDIRKGLLRTFESEPERANEAVDALANKDDGGELEWNTTYETDANNLLETADRRIKGLTNPNTNRFITDIKAMPNMSRTLSNSPRKLTKSGANTRAASI